MGIFGRLSDILSANINDLIDRAEDPQKMMDQMIRGNAGTIARCENSGSKGHCRMKNGCSTN